MGHEPGALARSVVPLTFDVAKQLGHGLPLRFSHFILVPKPGNEPRTFVPHESVDKPPPHKSPPLSPCNNPAFSIARILIANVHLRFRRSAPEHCREFLWPRECVANKGGRRSAGTSTSHEVLARWVVPFTLKVTRRLGQGLLRFSQPFQRG